MRIILRLHQVFCAALILLSGAAATMAQVPQLLNYQGRIAVNGTNFTGTGQFKFALVDGGTNLTHTATGTATVVYGFLVAVNVTDGGAGYSTPPTVSAIGGGGSGASFTAQTSAGSVTNVLVNNAGSGYSGTPTISFAAPPSNVVAQTFWSNDGSSSSGGQPATSVPLPVTKGLYSVLLGDTTLSNMTALPAVVFANPDVRLRVWFSDGATGFQQLTPDQRLAAVGYAIMAGTVPDGSITAGKIAPGAVGSSQLAPNLTISGTLTASNLVLNGSAMNGSGNYQIPSGTNIQTYAGGNYFITNTPANFILPTTATVGDIIRLHIPSANFFGGAAFVYNISQNPGQRIVKWNTLNYSYPLVSSADGSSLLVNGGSGFFLSTNSTANWTGEPPLQPWPTPNSYDCFQISGDGSHIFASATSTTYQGIVISRDYGQTWSSQTNIPLNGYGIRAIACSTNGIGVVAAVYYVGIFTSVDAGLSWTLQTGAPTNAIWSSIASSADGTKLVVCAQGNGTSSGIYTSGNSGQTWTIRPSAPTNALWLSLASSADGTKLVAVAQWDGNLGGIYTSGNSGNTWALQTGAPTNTSWSSVASSADGTKLVAASSDIGIYTSVNSGSTWMRQTNGLANGGQSCYAVTSSTDGSKLAAYLGDNKIYRSVDSGNSWSPCSTIPSPYSALAAVSTLGSSGGATFSYLSNGELTLVYLGNGMFAIDGPSGVLSGY